MKAGASLHQYLPHYYLLSPGVLFVDHDPAADADSKKVGGEGVW